MSLIIGLVVLGLGALAYAWVRANPKPADEPTEQYVEAVADGVEQEVVHDTETVVSDVAAEVKKATTKTSTTK